MQDTEILGNETKIEDIINNASPRTFEISSNNILFVGGTSRTPIDVVDINTTTNKSRVQKA